MSDADAIVRGDRRALARGLSLVEAGLGTELLDVLWKRTGHARRIGLTGPPGAGKSTLVAGLVRLHRAQERKVGIVAVDPTSPFTGGALLGDRHRVTRETMDEGVFFRSFASRGSVGGLARAAPAALDLLDAAGFDVVCVETVGVGQSEVEVAAAADSVAVILSPESGDSVQAMKAGLLEIADVLCVNKADRDGATELQASLESMLDLRADTAWRPPVVLTRALEGAEALHEALERHGAWLDEAGRLQARRQTAMESRLRRLAANLVAEAVLAGADELIAREAAAVHAGERSVQHAAQRAVEALLS